MRRGALHRVCICIAALFLAMPLSYARAQDSPGKLSLEQAIKEAINNNRVIRQAIEQEKAVAQQEKKALADFLPKLSTSYRYSHFRDNPYVYFQMQRAVITPGGIGVQTERRAVTAGPKDLFTWDFALTQPIFTGFALTTKKKLAELDVDLHEILKEQAIQDVTKNVKVAYMNVLLARRALDVTDEEVRQLEAHVRDAQHLHEQGVIPYNDLLKSQVALAQAKQNRVKARSNLDVAIAALNTLLNRQITANTDIEELPPFRPALYELSSLFNTALRHRPELRQLQVSLQQADLAVKLAKSAYYPQIFLDGRYEREGQDWDASRNDYRNDHNTIVSVQLTWSLFEWGKTKADVAAAMHNKRALQEKVEEIKNSIMLEVKQAYQDLKVAQENIHTAIEALKQAKENFRITNLQYKEGITTSTEVLDARAFLTQAEFNYYRALYGYRIAKAELERAIGASGDQTYAKNF